MAKSNPRVPIETALAPIGLAEVVGDFDRPDPFGVLVTELGRSAQPRSILGGYFLTTEVMDWMTTEAILKASPRSLM